MTAQALAGSVTIPHARSLARYARWIAALAIAVGIALFAWRSLGTRRVAHAEYRTARADRGPLAAKVTATGALSALVTVSVGSQVSGRIDTLGADFESNVKKGQVVATIEPSLFRAAVAQARATFASANAAVDKSSTQVALAARQLDRATQLAGEGLLSRADLDTARATLDAANADVSSARANVAQARAALDQAELNLRYTTIVSPIDGIVISRNVDIGQTVAAALQTPTLFTIAQDLTHMQVDTNVAEADVGKLHAAMPVTFTVDAYPNKTFAGTVRQVRDNAQTIQNVVTYDAVIDVDNPERLLKPGMTATVAFVYADQADALRVPTTALRFKPDPTMLALMGASSPPAVRADQRVVWLQRDGRVSSTIVDVGISDGVYTEVVRGDVQPSDVVIVEASEAKR
jgi:HlyD family secretion protein